MTSSKMFFFFFFFLQNMLDNELHSTDIFVQCLLYVINTVLGMQKWTGQGDLIPVTGTSVASLVYELGVQWIQFIALVLLYRNC